MTPGTFANLITNAKAERTWRERVLTLPVMVASVLSLVYRHVNYLTDVLRLLESEGLFGFAPIEVSRQALSQRLQSLPAEWFRQMFNEVANRLLEKSPPSTLEPEWQRVREKFTAIWMADGSSLERLKRQMGSLRELPKPPLAGKMMLVVEAITKRPIHAWYAEDAKTHDNHWQEELLKLLPLDGLLIFDLGFFQFLWFDGFTEMQRWFITRQKSKIKVKRVKLLSSGNLYSDEIVRLGATPKTACRHLLRRVRVCWRGKWYEYLSNVLEPQRLSAQEIVELYRQRWGIEEAFKLSKRLLGLAYLWVGGTNGIKLQLYATLLFYGVLMDVCADVAEALQRPLCDISVEMVFRSFYFYSRAREKEPQLEMISYLVQKQKMLGLVKTRRRRHRARDATNLYIWSDALT